MDELKFSRRRAAAIFKEKALCDFGNGVELARNA
jgi:hypothetical protein